jgi:hypothetical protein
LSWCSTVWTNGDSHRSTQVKKMKILIFYFYFINNYVYNKSRMNYVRVIICLSKICDNFPGGIQYDRARWNIGYWRIRFDWISYVTLCIPLKYTTDLNNEVLIKILQINNTFRLRSSWSTIAIAICRTLGIRTPYSWTTHVQPVVS